MNTLMSTPYSAAEQKEIIRWCKDNQIQGRVHYVSGRLMIEIPDPAQRMFFIMRWCK